MSTVYRIEIDIRIDNPTRTKVIQTAREDYRKSPFGGPWRTANSWKSQPKNSLLIRRRHS
jgi:hypothetical protein